VPFLTLQFQVVVLLEISDGLLLFRAEFAGKFYVISFGLLPSCKLRVAVVVEAILIEDFRVLLDQQEEVA
jgi:hypothetical protein